MSLSNSSGSQTADQSQITHVLNKDKKYLSEHGQKLFNAINCLLDDNEQLELTQALFKYQRDHNVFTLVRSCRELFDTSKKKVVLINHNQFLNYLSSENNWISNNCTRLLVMSDISNPIINNNQ